MEHRSEWFETLSKVYFVNSLFVHLELTQCPRRVIVSGSRGHETEMLGLAVQGQKR